MLLSGNIPTIEGLHGAFARELRMEMVMDNGICGCHSEKLTMPQVDETYDCSVLRSTLRPFHPILGPLSTCTSSPIFQFPPPS